VPRKLGPIGTTESVTSAGTTARIGAMWKITTLAPAGMNSSLKKSFATSAIGCSSPNGPDAVRAGARLHVARDLALGVDHVRAPRPACRSGSRRS
jgi:hypothetical protein